MTAGDLKIAADMFQYLDGCPQTLKLWIVFYNDLFQVASPDMIILTVNRLMKTTRNSFLRRLSQIIFKKLTTLFSLKYDDIHSLIPLKSKNISFLENPTSYMSLKMEGTGIRINIC